MPRGRPFGSEIRRNMVDILFCLGKGYGYQIHGIYTELFPPCTCEVIYYHLRQGVRLGEFEVDRVEEEPGDFSWGRTAEKTYYRLGPNAKPRHNEMIRKLVQGR